MRSAPETASPLTEAELAGPRPRPSAVQWAPSHRAKATMPAPPAFVKEPPMKSTPFTHASAFTVLSAPAPSANQLVPFHWATRLALLPPAFVKSPPAKRFRPSDASPLMPRVAEPRPPAVPSFSHLVSFQRATLVPWTLTKPEFVVSTSD